MEQDGHFNKKHS